MLLIDVGLRWTTLSCSAMIATNEREAAMPDWSIKFVPAKNPKPGLLADFVLDNPGNPTSPFSVYQGDNVSWNNTTRDDHQPAVYDPVGGAGPPAGNPQPIGDILKPHDSSDTYPVAAPAGSTVWFCCALHPNEVGTLRVIAPTAPPSV
jgi:hypothetical protein